MSVFVFSLWVAFSVKLLSSPPDLQTFLQDQIGLSQKDLQEMEQGKILTKRLDTEKESEVAIFGIMHLGVPVDFFIEKYRDIGTFMKADQVVGIGVFDNPPQLANLRSLTLDPGDILAIQECKVGDCHIKLPAAVIERFGREVDWSKPDSPDRATEMTRQMLLDYVKAYSIGGDAALGQYDDQEHPLRLADEFHELLHESRYLYEYVPEMHEYLESFPRAELPNAENVIYWSEKKYEKLRPILSLNHVTIFKRPQGDIKTLIASKQIYASHYFEASLEIAALVEENEVADGSGFYLLYLNRSRIDTLRKNVPLGMKHTIISEILNKVDQELKSTKTRIETLYQEENSPARKDQ